MLRIKNFEEMFFLVVRYSAWVYWCKSNPSIGVACYVFYNCIAASYIFINFAVSHTHKDVVEQKDHLDWVRFSANHTCNCNDNILTNWWMAYLNFQIEHHLFPSMPQYRHPMISPRVKSLFEKHGLEYDQRSYWTCMRVTFKNLWEVGNHTK